jgi:DHA1 family bicyclomycin/chloramphenicol resistance-like MFS transporter
MPGAPLRLTLLLGVLIALTPLGTDLYLPALPAIGQALEAPVERTQHTVTTYFLGMAIGQLVWGPLSDRYGRKPVLLAGLALALLAALAGFLASAVGTLTWARFAQGFGLSAGPVAARSVVRDLFAHEHAAHLLARMTIVFSVVPIAAPIAGALLLWLGWPAVFAAFAAVSLLLIVAVARLLPETAPAARADGAEARRVLRRFGAILREPRFTAHGLLLLCTFSGIFAFVSSSAFVLQRGLGVAPTAYALLFASVMLGQIAGAWLSSRLVMRLGIGAMLRLGTRLACAAGVVALGLALGGAQHWAAVVGPMAAYMFACSCIIPAATAAALSPFPGAAGAASSLVGTLQFALGAAVSSALGAAFDGTAGPMALVIALGGAGALLSERFLVRRIAARHAVRIAPR